MAGENGEFSVAVLRLRAAAANAQMNIPQPPQTVRHRQNHHAQNAPRRLS